jgi:hypothetical protein
MSLGIMNEYCNIFFKAKIISWYKLLIGVSGIGHADRPLTPEGSETDGTKTIIYRAYMPFGANDSGLGLLEGIH